MAVDSKGRIIVSDSWLHAILVFDWKVKYVQDPFAFSCSCRFSGTQLGIVV